MFNREPVSTRLSNQQNSAQVGGFWLQTCPVKVLLLDSIGASTNAVTGIKCSQTFLQNAWTGLAFQTRGKTLSLSKLYRTTPDVTEKVDEQFLKIVWVLVKSPALTSGYSLKQEFPACQSSSVSKPSGELSKDLWSFQLPPTAPCPAAAFSVKKHAKNLNLSISHKV